MNDLIEIMLIESCHFGQPECPSISAAAILNRTPQFSPSLEKLSGLSCASRINQNRI
jgi:hypothetical protein